MAKNTSKSSQQPQSKSVTMVGSYRLGLQQGLPLNPPVGEAGAAVWTSSNPDCVNVIRETGMISTRNPGSAVITAAFPSGNYYTWNVSVTNDSSQPPVSFMPPAWQAPADPAEEAPDPEPSQDPGAEPTDRGGFDLSMGRLLREGLDSLSRLDAKPPLPRIICGRVLLQRFDENGREQLKPMMGAVVELSGIASPAQDKIERSEDLRCFTDGYGSFALVMPDRYNMQETVTFTVSENPSAPEVLQRKQYLGGVGARSISFIRRASEIMKAARVALSFREETNQSGEAAKGGVPLMQVYGWINRLQTLRRENSLLRPRLQRQAELWVLERERREKRAELLRRRDAALEKRRQALTELVEALRALLGQVQAEALQLRELIPTREPQGRSAVSPAAMRIFSTVNPLPQEAVPNQQSAPEYRVIPDQVAYPTEDDPRLEELTRLAGLLQNAADRCQERLDALSAFLTLQLHRCEARLEDVGTEPFNFIIDDNCCEPLPAFDALLQPEGPGQPTRLDNLVLWEDDFLLSSSDEYPASIPIGSLRTRASRAKRKLALLVAELETLPPEQPLPQEQSAQLSALDQYLSAAVPDYKPQSSALSSDAETYVDNLNQIQACMKELGCENDGDLAELLNHLLTAELYADMGELRVLEDAFGEAQAKPAALPSVRLMGEGKSATFLPTDTAPSRIFNYGMIQRLVEPKIWRLDDNGTGTDRRSSINAPLDVHRFKQEFYANPQQTAIARSLGMGYLLNMHQAWVPDGFALGSLLYSLVLAPGEEQRIIVKEHKESYTVDDQAYAQDSIRDSYENSQQDNESAAFSNAVDRFSGAHSDYEYYSKASSGGSSGLSLFFGLLGHSSSSSVNKGHGQSNASQTDNYSEVSQAAQSFQTSIKTESERIAKAQRASIRVASSSDSESVASKIIANHNHSHVMTVQYWEVMRRYRMETCIEGIDLVLFVPLLPIPFLPTGPELGSAEDKRDKAENWNALSLSPATAGAMCKERFDYRYAPILQHADELLPVLPRGYRSGLETMKKFASYPDWSYFSSGVLERRTVTLTLTGTLLECDRLEASLILSTGRSPLRGKLVKQELISIHPSMNTRKDLLYFLKKAREGKYVFKYNSRMLEETSIFCGFVKAYRATNATTDRYIELDLTNGSFSDKALASLLGIQLNGKAVFTFTLPADVSELDIASIRIENSSVGFSYRLSQDTRYLEDYEEVSIKNYENAMYDFSKNNRGSADDLEDALHYRETLPECYTQPQVNLSQGELEGAGSLSLQLKATLQTGKGAENAPQKTDLANAYLVLENGAANADVLQTKPVMHLSDLERMEKTLRHIVTNTIHYSQVIWSSLSDDERIILLEPYTVDMDFSLSDSFTRQEAAGDQSAETSIPLLNCVNPRRVLGYYGNCMLLPFTYPERLAKALGKTAGEIQDELYRFHTTSFRVPSTVISVPTDGMVGEAVLGATNVSEKVDLTRFWNWKDSDIDHMSIDQSSFNGGSSLLANAQTMRVDAPTQGVSPTAHVDANGLAAALLARSPAQFADALGNTDIRQLLQSSDSNAAAGREAVVQANSGMVNTAVQAAADVAKSFFSSGLLKGGSGLGQLLGGLSGGDLKSILGGLSSEGLGKLVSSLSGDELKSVLGGLSGGDLGKLVGGLLGGSDGGGRADGGGGSEPPTENPNPPASEPDGPTPEPKSPAPDPKPNDPSPRPDPNESGSDPEEQNPAPDPSGLNYTPVQGAGAIFTPANEMEEQFLRCVDDAIHAIRSGSTDPIAFFCSQTGTDQNKAQAGIDRLYQEFSETYGVDIDAIIHEVLTQ